MNEVRQLNGKINDAKKQITNLYTEIGKKLYEQYKESALTGFESEIQTINEKYFQIEELKDQIRGVKGVVLCPCCNMEVGAAERYCSNCGSKMPEVFEIVDGDEAADAVHVESEDVTEPAGGPEKSYENFTGKQWCGYRDGEHMRRKHRGAGREQGCRSRRDCRRSKDRNSGSVRSAQRKIQQGGEAGCIFICRRRYTAKETV